MPVCRHRVTVSQHHPLMSTDTSYKEFDQVGPPCISPDHKQPPDQACSEGIACSLSGERWAARHTGDACHEGADDTVHALCHRCGSRWSRCSTSTASTFSTTATCTRTSAPTQARPCKLTACEGNTVARVSHFPIMRGRFHGSEHDDKIGTLARSRSACWRPSEVA